MTPASTPSVPECSKGRPTKFGHWEIGSLEPEVQRVLARPTEVRVSRSDASVQLFYAFYTRTMVGGKWLCVVVKVLPDADAFVITAYLTDKLKAGETVWPRTK